MTKPFYQLFFNGPFPASFRLFSSFQTNNFYNNKNVKKCPSSIRCWDWNPQLSELESPPITTRPGLPPLFIEMFSRDFRLVPIHEHPTLASSSTVNDSLINKSNEGKRNKLLKCSVTRKKSPNVDKSCLKMISVKNMVTLLKWYLRRLSKRR